MTQIRTFLLPIIVSIFTSLLISKEITLHTLYGPITISEPLILDLLETPSVERMKSIDQHGVHYFRKNHPTFTRYEHSIGVYYLLNRFKAPLIEQAAGLIHDISHTAFSHLSDVIYNHDEKVLPYQDSIHYWYLDKCNYQAIASKYNYTLNDLLFKNNRYPALESPLPDICADRLEYNLHTGYVFQLLTQKDIARILDDISFETGRWFFKTPSLAKQFASLSLYFTEHFWGSDWSSAIYKLAANMFQRALNLKIINFDDLHFATDAVILDKLYTTDDSTIQMSLDKCSHYTSHYDHGSPERHDYFIAPKFRGINPWIKVDNQFVRLTSLDLEFALEYLRVKEAMTQGHYLLIN
jgi:uncharacterized protein